MKTTSDKYKKEIDKQLEMFDCPKDTIEGTRMVFNVKRNYLGELFIEMVRRALNHSTYRMVVKGSHKDRAGMRKAGHYNVTDESVPVELADRFRVYIYQKDTHPDMKRISDHYKHVRELNDRIQYLESVIDQREAVENNAMDQIEEIEELAAQLAEQTEENRKLKYELNRIKLTLESITYSINTDAPYIK